jgi:hypothetical protein
MPDAKRLLRCALRSDDTEAVPAADHRRRFQPLPVSPRHRHIIDYRVLAFVGHVPGPRSDPGRLEAPTAPPGRDSRPSHVDGDAPG